MKIYKSKYTNNQKAIVFEQAYDPKSETRKAIITYDGKKLTLTSLCSLVGRHDQARFDVELSEEEVCDLWERVKDSFNGK